MSKHDPALGTGRNTWRGDAVVRGAVPTLYHSSGSYGSQVVRLALVEKGVAFRSRLVDKNADHTQARARATRTHARKRTQARLPLRPRAGALATVRAQALALQPPFAVTLSDTPSRPGSWR